MTATISTWKMVALIILGIAFGALGILASTHTHIDYIPALDTYGASVGSETTYASFDVVHGKPAVSWQSSSDGNPCPGHPDPDAGACQGSLYIPS